VPAFTGAAIPEQAIYAEALYARLHFAWSELYALTDSRYRLIRAPRDELYDVQEDVAERTNVMSAREATHVAMRQAIEKLMGGARIEAPAQVTAEEPESRPDPKDKVQVLEQYRNALALGRSGRVSESLARLQAIAEDNPGMADVWSEIGRLELGLGRTDDALESYKRLVETAPRDPSGLVMVARLLERTGELDGAQAQATAALAMLSPAEAVWKAAAHAVLMRIALDRHDEATARAEASRAHDADPSMPLPDMVEGLIRYEADQYADAVPFFEKAALASAQRTFPIPELHYYLGDSLAHLDRNDEAERELSQEITAFPFNLQARAGRAVLYRASGRISDADREVEDLLAASPGPEGYGLAVKLWTMWGETAKAKAASAQARQASGAPAPRAKASR
jgi:tetratricopeptide (TPR) repeat protein